MDENSLLEKTGKPNRSDISRSCFGGGGVSGKAY